MSDFVEWHRVESRSGDDEDNPFGPLPGFVDAVLDAVGPDVIAGSRNRLRALGCVLLGGVHAFAEDRVTKVSPRGLRRVGGGASGPAAPPPGAGGRFLMPRCQRAG